MTTPSQAILARRQLRLAAVTALTNAATLGTLGTPTPKILSPGDWNTPAANLPAIKIRNGNERKEAITKAVPQFTTTATLEIEATVEAVSDSAAQDAIDALAYAIENVIFTDYTIWGMVQQMSSIDTMIEITSDGRRQLGGIKMALSCEMYEEFSPTITTALTEVQIHADLANIYDPNGTYTGTLFPTSVQPAPRTSGPDGRDEGMVDITLPQ